MKNEEMNCSIGIDIGSRYTKLVVWNRDKQEVSFYGIVPSGLEPLLTAEKLLQKVNAEFVEESESVEKIRVCSTGYGRKLTGTPYLSEISCHAKAVSTIIAESKLIIDIGGQDSKVIRIDDNGKVVDFWMNDKCAAGTGSFLERIADLCKVKIDEIGDLALRSQEELNISSTCVVFAESEIISLINKNKRIEDILMAIHRAVVNRINNMLPDTSKTVAGKIVLTGGAANNKAIALLLERTNDFKLVIPPIPSLTGAIGAAIFAAEQTR